jgi:uncharacterized membrane protein
MGRHSVPDEIDGSETAAPGYFAAPSDAYPPAVASPSKTSAVADLQLVLHNPGLLAACVGAAIVPFVCYFAVIIALHDTGSWAIFLGAPLVLAGVLVGATLDRAYAQQAKKAPRSDSTRITVPASAAPAEPGLRSVEGARP